MRKLFVSYLLIWALISLVYLMSCFDGAYSERLYSIVEMVTLPWGLVTAKWGILLEKKHGFSLGVLVARYFVEVVVPAALDFGLIYGIWQLWEKFRHGGSGTSRMSS